MDQMGSAYYENLVENFPTQFDNTKNDYIETIKRNLKANPKLTQPLQELLIAEGKANYKDSIDMLRTHLQLSALGFYCLKDPGYRNEFLHNLSSYSNYFCRHFPGNDYDNRFMNILRYKEWGVANINENFLILFNDAGKIQNKHQLTQIIEWLSFLPLITSDRPGTVVIPSFWFRQYDYLTHELKALYLSLSVEISEINFYSYYKRQEMSLLEVCPQVYFALEAEYLKRNFQLFKAMNNTADSVKFEVSARRKNDGAEIDNSGSMQSIKFFTLLRRDDIKAYSYKTLKLYDDFVEENNVVTFDAITGSDDFYGQCDRFLAYYNSAKPAIEFWLHLEQEKQVLQLAVQKDIAALRFVH